MEALEELAYVPNGPHAIGVCQAHGSPMETAQTAVRSSPHITRNRTRVSTRRSPVVTRPRVYCPLRPRPAAGRVRRGRRLRPARGSSLPARGPNAFVHAAPAGCAASPRGPERTAIQGRGKKRTFPGLGLRCEDRPLAPHRRPAAVHGRTAQPRTPKERSEGFRHMLGICFTLTRRLPPWRSRMGPTIAVYVRALLPNRTRR